MIAEGGKSSTHAAASSIAKGIPSASRQILVTWSQIVMVQGKFRHRPSRTLDEEPNCCRLSGIHLCIQPLNWIDMLSRETQTLARGDQNLDRLVLLPRCCR